MKCSFSYLKLRLCVCCVDVMKLVCMWVMLLCVILCGIFGRCVLNGMVDGVMVCYLCGLLLVIWLLFFYGWFVFVLWFVCVIWMFGIVLVVLIVVIDGVNVLVCMLFYNLV